MKRVIVIRKIETEVGDNGEYVSAEIDVEVMKKELSEKYVVKNISYTFIDGGIGVVFECMNKVVREPRDTSNLQMIRTYKIKRGF
jgi:hypothetical protein